MVVRSAAMGRARVMGVEGKIKDNGAPGPISCCLHIIFRSALLNRGSAPVLGFSPTTPLGFGGRSLPALSRNPALW